MKFTTPPGLPPNLEVAIANGDSSFKINCGYVTETGEYPGDPNRSNQDSFVVIPKFCSDPKQFLVVVFDGACLNPTLPASCTLRCGVSRSRTKGHPLRTIRTQHASTVP